MQNTIMIKIIDVELNIHGAHCVSCVHAEILNCLTKLVAGRDHRLLLSRPSACKLLFPP